MNLWHRLNVIYGLDALGQSEKHVAAYLAFRVNEVTRTARLGAGTIAKATGFDRRTVQRIVDRLERLELVTVQRSGKWKGKNAANLYTLRLTEIAAERRYSQKANSGTDDTRIAAPVHSNSGTAPHKPSEPFMNHGATSGARPPKAAPLRAGSTQPGESLVDRRRRQLRDLGAVLQIIQAPGEPDSVYIERVERANAMRLERQS